MAISRVVYIGGARGDEVGAAHGGKAGDQTGNEVAESKYKLNKKGWLVFRAYDFKAREKLAEAMIAACNNPNIGYDQYQRDTLYNAVVGCGYNPALVTKPVETDCSALVRVCCAYAGIFLPSFRTSNEPSVLINSGEFGEIPLNIETLEPGDILCTPVQGHTEIVTRVSSPAKPVDIKFGVYNMSVLMVGAKGTQVKVLQVLLNSFCGAGLAVDGEFGPKTKAAVIAMQTSAKLQVDGIVGVETWTTLLKG